MEKKDANVAEVEAEAEVVEEKKPQKDGKEPTPEDKIKEMIERERDINMYLMNLPNIARIPQAAVHLVNIKDDIRSEEEKKVSPNIRVDPCIYPTEGSITYPSGVLFYEERDVMGVRFVSKLPLDASSFHQYVDVFEALGTMGKFRKMELTSMFAESFGLLVSAIKRAETKDEPAYVQSIQYIMFQESKVRSLQPFNAPDVVFLSCLLTAAIQHTVRATCDIERFTEEGAKSCIGKQATCFMEKKAKANVAVLASKVAEMAKTVQEAKVKLEKHVGATFYEEMKQDSKIFNDNKTSHGVAACVTDAIHAMNLAGDLEPMRIPKKKTDKKKNFYPFVDLTFTYLNSPLSDLVMNVFGVDKRRFVPFEDVSICLHRIVVTVDEENGTVAFKLVLNPGSNPYYTD